MYQLPQEISSKTEIFRGITFEDMIFVLLYFMIFYVFQRFVYAGLVVIYYVFNIAVAIYLISRSRSPRRRMYELLLFRFCAAATPARYWSAPAAKGGMEFEE